MRVLYFCACAAVINLAAPLTVSAQGASDAAPPHVAFVDGNASVDRAGRPEQALGGVPLGTGDRISTERGRVELLFPDGTALDLDEFTSVEIREYRVVGVTNGRVLLTVPADGASTSITYRVDTPVASVDTFGGGEYRISINGNGPGVSTELAVLRGSAVLSAERGVISVRGGEVSTAMANIPPARPQPFASARLDAFDQWTAMRQQDRRAAVSSQYMPPELRMYSSELDEAGSWHYENSYGYVWYPTVAVGWTPYYDGYWSTVPGYGWTWIGHKRWHYPTHHYGRWGVHDNRWFWMPGKTWGPGWVGWGSTAGFVGWSPLGIDNRPVFALSASVGSVPNGWTVMPRDHFGGPVPQWGSHRFAGNAPLVGQARPPVGVQLPANTRPAGSRVQGVANPASVIRTTALPRSGGSVGGSIGGAQTSASRTAMARPGNARPDSVAGITVYRGGQRNDQVMTPVPSGPSRYGQYWSGSVVGRPSTGGVALSSTGGRSEAQRRNTLPMYRAGGQPAVPGLVDPNQANVGPNFFNQADQRGISAPSPFAGRRSGFGTTAPRSGGPSSGVVGRPGGSVGAGPGPGGPGGPAGPGGSIGPRGR